MKKALLVMLGVGCMVSCGAAPIETVYSVRVHDTWCDVLHRHLSESQKNSPYDFYLGANAGDCKASYNAELADGTTAIFGSRKLATIEADKCIEAISKLAQTDVTFLMANRIAIATHVGTAELQLNARKAALSTLGVASDDMSPALQRGNACRPDGMTCNASAGCALNTTTGPCALFKVAPLKDGNLSSKEAEAYTMTGGSIIDCGGMWGI